jgi:hypothetical protein
LFPAAEVPGAVVAAVAVYEGGKRCLGYQAHYLGEYIPAVIHKKMIFSKIQNVDLPKIQINLGE